MKVTEALKKFRKERGLSQKDIADVLDTTPQNIHRLEKVDSAISAEAIVKIAKKFNVSTDYILGMTNNPIRSEVIDEIVELINKQKKVLEIN